MEITGKIIQVLPARSGVSQRTGTEWKSQSYVLETMEQYARKMCFDVFGADKIQSFNIQVGETMTVSFDIDAHEYQGRWYNSVRAWKVDRNTNPAAQPAAQPGAAPAAIPPYGGAAPAAAPAAAAPAAPAAEATDDLPF